MRRVRWLAAALLLAGFHPAEAETPPRALLALFETTGVSLPQGPLPNGLRFVLYDDGEVITRSGPTPADPDPPGRGVRYGKLDPAATESLWRDAVADVKTIAAIDSGIPNMQDAGVTILEIWDGDRYRRFSATVRPCQAEGRDFTAGPWAKVRAMTDRAFLKVCDRLMQFQIPAPLPWKPKAAELRLGALDGAAERQADWPKAWPPAPADLKPKSAVAFCAPLNDADFSATLVKARWSEIGQTGLAIDAGRSAVIWDWYFDLPAEIPLLDEKGATTRSVGTSCP
jgi:hypothetical protein